jgi:hypothetical protein
MCLGGPENAHLPGPHLPFEVRLGKKKAALAIAHKILVIVYHLLAAGTSYEETRYDQWNPRQEARERQRAIKALERLGYTVTVERAA